MKRTNFNWELSRKSVTVILSKEYPTKHWEDYITVEKKYPSTHWKTKFVSLQAAKDNAEYQNFDQPLKWKETKNGFISERTTLGRYKIRKL